MIPPFHHPRASARHRFPPATPAPEPVVDGARLLRHALGLLRGLQDPGLLRLAQARGYGPTQHEAGWTLYREAMGEAAPSNDVELAPRSPEVRALTAFWALWFLRTRGILRRVVPLARRDAFEGELFSSLTLEVAPGDLTRSLRVWLDRVEALPSSGVPGARTLATMLRARGLHDGLIAATRARLAALDAAIAEGAVDPFDLVAAAPANDRAEALAALDLWYRTWAGVLRGGFSYRQRVHLGLSV